MQTGPSPQGSLLSPRDLGKGHYWKTLQFNRTILVLQVGSDEITKRSPRIIKDFRALGRLFERSEAQIMFSLILPAAKKNIKRNRQTHHANMSPRLAWESF